MSFGKLLRDVRLAHGFQPLQFAARLCEVTGRDPGECYSVRDQLKRWEADKVVPGASWCAAIAHALDTPVRVIRDAATVARVNRRAFLGLTALTATHGRLAADLTASVAGGDPGPLMTVQTTHGTDLVIASFVDKATALRLQGWMIDGASPTLRVNAAGILAKVPGQGPAERVARLLRHDEDVRRLYSTAVISRTCALDWDAAAVLAGDPLSAGDRARFLASRLAIEVVNENDAGARWVSATVLRDLVPLLSKGYPA